MYDNVQMRARDVIIHKQDKFSLLKLSKFDCHKKLSGVCALDADEFDVGKNNKDILYDKNFRYNYGNCRQIYQAFLEDKISAISVDKYSCGHFCLTDATHRLCVAQQKDLLIKLNIKKNLAECNYCKNTSTFKKFILSILNKFKK